MPEINGKRVEFKQRFPARENWDLPRVISSLGSQAQGGAIDFEASVPVLQRMIDSWDFDGDPKDAESYGELDLFRELIPLLKEAASYIQELTGAGEAESGRT